MADLDQGGVAVPKIKLIRNAKFDPQWEITVVPGADEATMDSLREAALAQDAALTEALR